MSLANVVMFQFETSEDLESWAEWNKNNLCFLRQEKNVFVKTGDRAALGIVTCPNKKQEKQAEDFAII